MLPPLAAVEIGDSPQTALDPFFGLRREHIDLDDQPA